MNKGNGLGGDCSRELELLERIDAKMDKLGKRMDGLERRAATAGAVAGGVSGGLAGGVVAVGILYIKAKLGW
ncbi:MAG TPA: hypothetical protein DEF41_08610 [Desulfovibrio sp.]|nr:hypothetical protein [Desulfovibrio sp.]